MKKDDYNFARKRLEPLKKENKAHPLDYLKLVVGENKLLSKGRALPDGTIHQAAIDIGLRVKIPL